MPALEAAVASVRDGAPQAVLTAVPVGEEGDDVVNALVTPFAGTNDEGAGSVLVVAEDVTEELATKARLIHTERLAAIGRMAAHVTHEVRNPLSSIGLNVEMLEEELEGAGPETIALMRAITREIDRLTGITEEYRPSRASSASRASSPKISVASSAPCPRSSRARWRAVGSCST